VTTFFTIIKGTPAARQGRPALAGRMGGTPPADDGFISPSTAEVARAIERMEARVHQVARISDVMQPSRGNKIVRQLETLSDRAGSSSH